MSRIETDVLLVGSGLGATAAAQGLLQAGYRVVLIPGIGRTRSAHVDGGVVDEGIVARLFGDGAPLGDSVTREVMLRATSRSRFDRDVPIAIDPSRRYQRHDLEAWAMAGVVDAGAIFLDDFIEGQVLPRRDGDVVLMSERDDREIVARVIALCEGADPRIPMRVHLRPDYGPEDQLHFARTMFHGEPGTALLRGAWRSSWGMPVEIAIIPQAGGTILSVGARIENIMRASRSSRDALEDLLASPAFPTLGITGDRAESGMELVALRRQRRDMLFMHDRLAMGIDMSGVIDPRRIDRADLTMRAGHYLAAYLADSRLALDGWQHHGSEFVRDVISRPGSYHDDKETGFLEEGPKGPSRRLGTKLAGIVRRGHRAVAVRR